MLEFLAGPAGAGFRMDAPGNLLLCGEYAITEPEGEGIWLAATRQEGQRAHLSCRSALAFTLALAWPGAELSWDPSQIDQELPAVLSSVLEGFPAAEGGPAAWLGPWELRLDTSAFFDPSGRKLGFGSSAAAVLLLSAALLRLNRERVAALPPMAGLLSAPAAFAAWAAKNHRRFQGGKGSGYDVLASFYGGMGRFVGGEEPRGERLDPRLEAAWPAFRIVPGPAAVKTVSSLSAWQSWRSAQSAAAQAYRAACQARAQAVARLGGGDLDRLLELLDSARADGIALGAAIGVSAETPPAAVPGTVLLRKALGAGNETILELPLPGRPAGEGAGIPCRLDPAGLVCRPLAASAEASGKLLLFGEHVAFYGWPALGTPLGQGCRILACAAAGPADQAAQRWPDLTPELALAADQVLARALAAFPGLVLPPLQFFVESGLPEGSGYGSSAAFSAALAQLVLALAEARGVSCRLPGAEPDAALPGPERIWLLANHLDGYFHGKASGIDTGLSLSGAPACFLPAPERPLGLERRTLELPRHSGEWWIVHAALPRLGSTKSLVAGIRQGMEAQEARFAHGVKALGQISQAAIAGLERGASARDLGCLADEAQAILGNLGLSTQTLEQALLIGRAAGASGGKLSGAGGGGAFYLWAESEDRARAVCRALADSGLPLRSAPRCFRLG